MFTFACFMRYAWVAEDSYVNWRVVNNFLDGNGPNWNLHQRVQVFTSPLWFLLQSFFGAFFLNVFVLSILLSLVVASLAVCLLIAYRRASYAAKTLLVLLPLLWSKAFFDYAACGFEGAIGCLVVGAFFWWSENRPAKPRMLVLLAALVGLTRYDFLLLILPNLIWTISTRRREFTWRSTVRLLSPLWVWMLFSLFYYGFVLPNPLTANLDNGFSLNVRLDVGVDYFRYFSLTDAWSFAWLSAALAMAIFRGAAADRLIAAGLILYAGYLFYNGGDYWDIRLMVLPVYMASMILYRLWGHLELNPLLWRMAAVIVLGLGVKYYQMTYATCQQPCMNAYGFRDEKAIWLGSTGLFQPNGSMRAAPEHEWMTIALENAKNQENKDKIAVIGDVGLYGYYSPASHEVIGLTGNTDPLLARLHAQHNDWAPGHYYRHVPDGYLNAYSSNDVYLMQPDLGEYYRQLWLVISEHVFSFPRFKAIFYFHSSRMQKLLDNYNDTQPQP